MTEEPNAADIPEMERREQTHLHEEIDAIIRRSIEEYDITPVDVVGILECIKHEFLKRMDEEYDCGCAS